MYETVRLSIDALSKYIELYHQGEETKDTRRDILYKEREIYWKI